MANETTISTLIKVNGLDQLREAKSLMDGLKSSARGLGEIGGLGKGASELTKMTTSAKELKSALESIRGAENIKMGNGVSKELNTARESAQKLHSALKEATEVPGATAMGEKLSSGISRSTTQAERLNSQLRSSAGSENELASRAARTAQAEEKSAQAAQRGAQARKQAAQASSRMFAETEKKSSRLGAAIRDSFAMFSLGQLGANAVMSAGQGIKNIFKGGMDFTKEQQTSQVAWATNAQSVNQVLGKKMSAQQAQVFSKGMVKDLTGTALRAGNDYSMVSDAALALYATGKGVSTAGNKKKTLQLTKDMLNLQDAAGLSDWQMKGYTQAIAKSLDQNKVTSQRMMQLQAANPLYDDYIKKAYKKRTGKDWVAGKDKYSAFTGEDVVQATRMMGALKGISTASANFNKTIAGATRAMKSGSQFLAGTYLTKFGDKLNKAFGGDGQLFSRISDFFTNEKQMTATANKLASASAGVATTVGHAARQIWDFGKSIGKVAMPFAKDFGKGFVDEIKLLSNGVKDGWNSLKGLGKKVTELIPKSTSDKISGFMHNISGGAGKITAVLTALRGFSKLPGMAGVVEKTVGPIMRIIDKVPLIGRPIASLIKTITGINPRQSTAGNTMQRAADTMMSAANRMATGGVGAGLSSETGALTRAEAWGNYGGYGPKTRSTLMREEGERILGMEGGRVAARRGLFGTLKGKTLVKLGTMGERVGASTLGRGLMATGRFVKGTGSFLSKGAPGMNALFAGLDIYSAMKNNPTGTIARHKGVGKAVGTGIGSTIGMAAGTLIPGLGQTGIGQMIGGVAGGWLGGKIGSWVGGKTGGTKAPKIPKTQNAYNKAMASIEGDQWKQSYVNSLAQHDQNGNVTGNTNGLQSQAKTAYKLFNRGQKSKNWRTQKAGINLASAVQNGDQAKVNQYSAELSSRIKKEDWKGVSGAAKKANKAYGEAYQNALETAKYQGLAGKAAKKYARNEAKKDGDYKKASKKEKTAKKQYEKDFGKGGLKSALASHKDLDSHPTKTKKKKKGTNNDSPSRKPKSKRSRKSANDKLAKTAKKNRENEKKSSAIASKEINKSEKNSKKAIKSAGKAVKKGYKNMTKSAKSAFKKLGKHVSSGLKSAGKSAKKHSKNIAKSVKKGLKSAAKSAKNETKKIGKSLKSGFKSAGKAAKKPFSKIGKSVKSALKKAKKSAKSGAKSVSKAIKSGLKSAKKGAKSAMKGVSKSVKSEMKKAKRAAKSGSKSVSKAIKSGMKGAKRGAKSAMKGVSKAVKSEMKKAKRAAKSGARGVGKSIKSGMKSAKNGAKSAMRGVASAVKSGMNKAKRAARSGARGLSKSIKAGLKGAKSGAKSAMRGVSTAIKSEMSKAKSAARSGARGVSSAMKSGFSKAASSARKSFSKLSSSARSSFNKMSSSATSTAGKVSSAFGKIGTAATTATGKVKSLTSAIKSVKSKKVSVKATVSGTSKVKDLANAISQVKNKSVMISAHVQKSGKLATGTPGALGAFTHLAGGWSNNGGVKAGHYVVNDAPGSSYQEAFKTKKGLVGLFPKIRNLFVPLEEGTQVLNAKDTKNMFPRLKDGTPGSKDMKSKPSKSGNVFNITVNVDNSGSNGDPTTLGNKIANIIAEKLRLAFPEAEV